ncbi:hypothetical protein GLOIN_2v1774909 [Rhizophagus irregularis DAOM 181602=DAOM 197198]|nr:hypothetical protein GLOIN_2v1774909 [Rhizophagus irregularis DAOM 181602=DAOM 197198]
MRHTADSANAFPVHIDGNSLVGDLKKAIKAEKQNDFAGIDADKLKLWKVEIGGDHLDDQLKSLKLNGSDELSAINEIGDYWKPPKKHIHVLVEPPVSATASNEVLELREKLASLQALLNKSVHAFDVVVSPKRTKSFKWTVNIEHATLDGLKNSIRAMNQTLALENDGAVLNMLNDSGKFSPQTPSKPFNEWSFPKVCELYGLSDDPNPSIDVYPVFSCGSAEKYKEALRKLFDELETRVATTPIDDQVKVVPEKLIEGKNGRGNLDYGIESRTTGRIVGLVEVKKDDFKQGFAQATVQLESSLGRKRKANEMDDEHGFDKVWGIVTDAEKWYFMECTQDAEGKPLFKLSKPLFVVYEYAGMKDMAEKILGHIIWLLEESQKADSAVNLDKEREIKRSKSLSKIAEK